eukprot:UN32371
MGYMWILMFIGFIALILVCILQDELIIAIMLCAGGYVYEFYIKDTKKVDSPEVKEQKEQLRKVASENRRTFEEVCTVHIAECFLARILKSKHRHSWVLTGGLMTRQVIQPRKRWSSDLDLWQTLSGMALVKVWHVE